MGRNGRQRRMGALLTVVTAMFAVLLMMAGMTTPALAAEQHAAVTINAERVAAGEYRLTITNNGSETIVKATGATTVPQEILADGAAASYAWQVSGLQSGASAVAQQDGKALTSTSRRGPLQAKPRSRSQTTPPQPYRRIRSAKQPTTRPLRKVPESLAAPAPRRMRSH